MQKAPSPINLLVLPEFLMQYPDKEAAVYLLNGFKEAFPFQGIRCATSASNLKSVKGMEEVVRRKIQKEVAERRVDRPFAEIPVPTLHISPLGVVLKKSSGEFWLIHHLSYSAGESANDTIRQELCTVRYISFDATIRMVRSCSTGAELVKADIKSVFH